MAQNEKFYKIHGENGAMYYFKIICEGLEDSKIRFPIHEMKNEQLFKLFKECISFRRVAQIKQLSNKELTEYKTVKSNYFNELAQFHIN